MIPRVGVDIYDFSFGESREILGKYLEFGEEDETGHRSVETDLIFDVDKSYRVRVLAQYAERNAALTIHVLLDEKELSHVSLFLTQVLGYYTSIPDSELVVSIVADFEPSAYL